MTRLWKRVNGEPYMINPRLGVLALQALNPPKKRHKKNMAKRWGRAHMAWVRRHKKNPRRKHHRKYKHNAYPLAGTIAAMGNPRRKHHRRRHKSNPVTGGISHLMRGSLGLPPLMPVVYGMGGFVGTAMIQGFVDTLVPATWKTNTDGSTNMLTKYAEIGVSIVAVTYLAKMIKGGAGAMAGIGGGIFALQQAAHDFLPGVIPGMHSYTPLKAYTPVRVSSGMGGMRRYVQSAGGAMPQLAARTGMPQLAAPDFGAMNTASFAADGAMNVVSSRFRRFQ